MDFFFDIASELPDKPSFFAGLPGRCSDKVVYCLIKMLMKRLICFFSALFALVSAVSFAQTQRVSGLVTEAGSGEPLPGATVLVKGTSNGVSSDADGKYVIEVPSGATLVFSTIGFATVEQAVDGRTLINVSLSPDTEFIDETVVIAFGKTTKEAFTGSATVVKSDDIAKVQNSNPVRALEGVVAGVQMTTSSGALGSSPAIRIRGISSISADSAPLYVVDGVPYSGDLNNINSADIESMTVLKDAASNSLYGARGANGVIMITTKKAKRGDAVVTLDAKVGVNTKALKNYDYITDPGQYYETHYAALYNYYLANGDPTGIAHSKAATNTVGPAKNGGLGYNVFTVPEGETLIGSNGKLNPNAKLGRTVSYNGKDYLITPDNWLDEAYRVSMRQEYNASVSGSTDKMSFYGSFGYLQNEGIIDNSDMYRYTANLRADYQAKSWLKVGGDMRYTNFYWNNSSPSESAGSTGSLFGVAIGMAPIYPLYIRNADGSKMIDSNGFVMYDFGNGQNAGLSRPNTANANPFSTNLLDVTVSEGNAVNGTGFAEIRFLDGFTFTQNVGYGVDETRTTDVANMYYGQFVTNGGVAYKAHSRSFYVNVQQLLNWNKTFGLHNIDVLLGHEYYKSESKSLSASKSKLFSMDNLELNGAVVDSQKAASSASMYNNEGYFSRIQYDYAGKLYASLSYRRDASSRFAPENRWGNFWSAGAGWLLNKEDWFAVSWVDMLKVKASIGSQGNDNISDYLYTDTYSITNSNDEISVTFNNKGNRNITWETNTNINAGVDFELFGKRLNGAFEAFYRKTSDMLFFFSVPASLGYSGYYDNVGDMRNSGIEFALNGDIVRAHDFVLSGNFNATHYTNKITYLPEEKKTVTMEGHAGYASGNYFYGEGLPLYTRKMPKYAGIDHETGEPMWYKDVTAEDGTVSRTTTKSYREASDYLVGAPTPKLYGGFGFSASFRGFDASVQFTYQLGGKAYDSGYAASLDAPGGSIGDNFHKDVLNAWTPENKSSDMPRFQYLDQNFNSVSDRFFIDASYLNFQNAQLGYTLPEKLTSKMQISKLRVYVSADNIWYVSKRQGFDPRYSFTGTTNYATNSTVRTISGGINLTF